MFFYKSEKNMFFNVFYSKINVFNIYDHNNYHKRKSQKADLPWLF